MATVEFKVSFLRGKCAFKPVDMEMPGGSVVEGLQESLVAARFYWNKKDKDIPPGAYVIKAGRDDDALAPTTVLASGATYYVALNRKCFEEPAAKRPRGRPEQVFDWLDSDVPLNTVEEMLLAKAKVHSYETQMSKARTSGDAARLEELTASHGSLSKKIQEFLGLHGATVSELHQATGTLHTKKVMAALNTVAGAVLKREAFTQGLVNTIVNYGPASASEEFAEMLEELADAE